jgi:hypothetical protein
VIEVTSAIASKGTRTQQNFFPEHLPFILHGALLGAGSLELQENFP